MPHPRHSDDALAAAEATIAELVEANEAVRRITDRLSERHEVAEFLTTTLVEVSAASGAVSAAVFVYEPADDTLRKACFVWQGEPLDVQRDPRLELWRSPVPAEITDCWRRMLDGEPPVWTDLERPPADQWDFAVRWHHEIGHRLIAAFPLRVGGHPVGFLRLGFATEVRPTAAQLQLCRTLAQQAALALEINRTTARARSAAAAVEHERMTRERLGELAAANRILVHSLDGFTANPNPDEFLAKVLMQLCDVLDVPLTELWYARDMSGLVFPGPMWHDGRMVTPDESGHPMRAIGYRIPTSYNLADAVEQRRHILWHRLADHTDVPPHLWQWYRDRFGVEKMINLPLVVGRKVIGAAVGFAPLGHTHTDYQLELGHALATQLALALQLGELNERAKSVAVLEVKEQAARERAAELEQLNAVLTLGAERVAAAGDLGGVVVGFLQEAKVVTRARCAAAFRLLDGNRHLPLAVIIRDRVLSPAEIDQATPFTRFVGWPEQPASDLFRRLSAGESVYLSETDWDPCLDPQVISYHREAGNVMVWYLPLMLANTIQGYVTLGIPQDDRPTEWEERQLRAIRQHMTLAVELHRLAEQERRAAVLAERTRLAREIHDTLAQGFLGILLHTETARRTLLSDPPRAGRALELAHGLARSSLSEARRSVGVLRAGPAGADDLTVSLSMLVQQATDQGVFPARFDSALTTCPVPPDVGEQIIRIVAEAIQNARRHAQPTQVVVTLSRTNGTVTVTVGDDGVGFDPEAVPAGERYGLLGMRERAAAAGCELTIRSAAGRGTTITVSWPLHVQNGGDG